MIATQRAKTVSEIPIYAPLLNPPIFTELLLACPQRLLEFSTPDPITYQNGASVHDDANLSLTRSQNLADLPQPGPESGFRSVNLTWIPSFVESKSEQFYFDSNGIRRAFLFRENETWQWRTDIEFNAVRTFVDSLGLRRISLVRIVYLCPPAIGGVHIDAAPTAMQRYYAQQGVSLSFNLLPGDGTLSFLRLGQVHKIAPEHRAWHFDPSAPHSVGVVNQFRAQLRVFGELENETYLKRLDLGQAVWAHD